MSDAFERARTAYRVIDQRIVAIGSEEQAVTFTTAVSDVEEAGVFASRTHLVSAGAALRNGDWAGSVRESIHAVEAMSKKLEPDAKTLGEALKKLKKGKKLHVALEGALTKLYGYSNDEEGIRHALVFQDAPDVDEADALFMLSACSAFVSYLVAKV